MDELKARASGGTAETFDVSAEFVRDELARLLRSQAFANAPSLRRLLTHIVERTLDGKDDELKEYSLGVDVFDRGEQFDPKTDTIVRVQARRLRLKLQEYYRSEGRSDVIVIDLAKGHYVPEFRRRRWDASSSVIQFVAAPSAERHQSALDVYAELNHQGTAGATDPSSTRLRTPTHAADSRLQMLRRLRAKMAALVVTVAAVTASAIVLPSRHSVSARDHPGSPPNDSAVVAPATPTASRSLAVLPFQQLDPTSGDDVQGLGMADSLITRLGLLQNLAVRPLASARLYANKDPQVAGRELHVDSVLDGSMQTDADRVRVRVRLYRVSDGKLLWADHFDQPFRDIFALQDSISDKVATALSLQFGARSRPAVDRQAYENYVRGRYFFEQFTYEGNLKAVEYFENAIRLQPDFAEAYGGLALNYCPMIMRGFVSVGEGTSKLRKAVEQAIALDDSLPEAHTALATLRWLEFDWVGAENALKRALELNPSYLHAYSWSTFMLDMLGREDEALALRKRELELDPVSDYAAKDLGVGLLLLGRYAEAVEQMHKALELRPGFAPAQAGLAGAYIGLNRLDDAHRGFIEAGSPFGAAYVRVLQGDPGPARTLIDRFADGDFRTRTALATLHTALGEKEQALLLLERAVDERDAAVFFLKVDPSLKSLRGEPRFKNLIARMRM